MSVVRALLRLPVGAAAVSMLLFAAPASAAASGPEDKAPAARGSVAGPRIADCGKLKPKAARACLAANKANRIAFNQIKDHTFTGVRGDGAEVTETYCANGKFESSTTDSYGTGISKGSSWHVADAVVKQGGKSITAFIEGTGGFEVALLRSGAQWKVAVASLGRVLDPGNVTRTDAKSTCAAM